MTDITSILTPSKYYRQDAASDLLMRAAMHIRKRHTDNPRLTMNRDFAFDLAAANNLLVLSREVLYETVS